MPRVILCMICKCGSTVRTVKLLCVTVIICFDLLKVVTGSKVATLTPTNASLESIFPYLFALYPWIFYLELFVKSVIDTVN